MLSRPDRIPARPWRHCRRVAPPARARNGCRRNRDRAPASAEPFARQGPSPRPGGLSGRALRGGTTTASRRPDRAARAISAPRVPCPGGPARVARCANETRPAVPPAESRRALVRPAPTSARARPRSKRWPHRRNDSSPAARTRPRCDRRPAPRGVDAMPVSWRPPALPRAGCD